MSTPVYGTKRVNRIGLEVLPYRGGKTTLCAGCGHNAITERLVETFWELNIPPWTVMKLSGIGCSSKTPAYFLSQSHGFNAVHGRAATVATGALLANHTLRCLVVTGDGDTASIGIGHFIHMLRRGVPLMYVIENNGVYGLTKGQFSATADSGSKAKTGSLNRLKPIDCCLAGIEVGATLVARSFSGDKRQLSAILKACVAHRGLSIVDVISPCTTFNDHEGSTKSYGYMKDHSEPLHEIDFVPAREDIAVDYEEGSTREVTLHDGSRLVLRKLGRDHDPTNRLNAIRLLTESQERKEVLTGILYASPAEETLIDSLNLVDSPLATLPDYAVRPSREVLRGAMDELS
jgi:2-oxoglutarate/2-oxoacid ferredoxin oxidoreductase subunit beta